MDPTLQLAIWSPDEARSSDRCRAAGQAFPRAEPNPRSLQGSRSNHRKVPPRIFTCSNQAVKSSATAGQTARYQGHDHRKGDWPGNQRRELPVTAGADDQPQLGKDNNQKQFCTVWTLPAKVSARAADSLLLATTIKQGYMIVK